MSAVTTACRIPKALLPCLYGVEHYRVNPMYYLTVKKNGEYVIRRREFADYSAAIAFTAQFYRPKAPRSVLQFTTEVINGAFARSFAALNRPEDLDPSGPYYTEKRHTAAKQSNAFAYDASYLFVIDSDVGIRDAEAMQAVYESEE